MGVLPEIGMERWWQDMPEEGGLVDTLRSDEGQNLLIILLVVHPCGNHADKPFLERPIE